MKSYFLGDAILKKKNRPLKLDDRDLLSLIRECIRQGRYFQSLHFIEKIEERNVNFLDALYVLQNGHHEKKKTCFHEISNKWRYAIRGKTTDTVEIRVAITFDDNDMIIITVIDLLKKGSI